MAQNEQTDLISKNSKIEIFWRFLELKNQSERIVLLFPIVFGFGAGFGLTNNIQHIESIFIFTIITFAIGLGFFLNRSRLTWFSFVAIILFLSGAFSAGIVSANWRAQAMKAPIFDSFGKKNEITGKIVSIDRNYLGRWRAKIKIDEIVGYKKTEIPKFVRVTIDEIEPQNINQIIHCKAVLNAPNGSIFPYAYDFARKAWFSQIGAIGYCKNAIFTNSKKSTGFIQNLNAEIMALRVNVSNKLAKNEYGGGGGFLAAIATGDRSYISGDDLTALQTSGLEHIISVSGLHVGLLAAISFFGFVKFLCLFQSFALRHDARKYAAFISIILVWSYTIFTGGEAPAVRSAFMVTMAFLALIFDRSAINMRNLAMAAMILLGFAPENALDAGFQMSFLATMALVALWENRYIFHADDGLPQYRIVIWVKDIILASIAASLATMPIAIANFGRFYSYGLLANIVSAPIDDFLVGPAALLGAIFSFFPLHGFGLSEFFFEIARFGLGFLLKFSYFVAELPFSSAQAPFVPPFAQVLLICTIIWLCLWRGGLRIVAGIIFLAAIIQIITYPKSEIYISTEAKAFIQARNDFVKEGKVCFSPKEKFAASQMISALNLAPKERKLALQQLQFTKQKNCKIGKGDYEAHFIGDDYFVKFQDLQKIEYLKSEKTTKKLKSNPIISLSFDGKTYAFDKLNTPNGAILQRAGWQLRLYWPMEIKTPWQKARVEYFQNMRRANFHTKTK